jgi:hypothetical protein
LTDITQIVAHALADDACCGSLNEDGTCCLTEKAERVLRAIEEAGGPSLAEIEAQRSR